MHRPSNTTVHILPAANSGKALVIRRGPSKWWHFLLWDRENGEVTPGSWFNGMVYPHRCDLSPKGDWMLLLAMKGGNSPCAWTALCRPPNVSAVAFWPQTSSRVGGGYFDQRLPIAWINLIGGDRYCERRGDQPFDFGYIEQKQELFGSIMERIARDRWSLRPAVPEARQLVWSKPSPKGGFELIMCFDGTQEELVRDPSLLETRGRTWHLLPVGGAEMSLGDVSWANWNSKGELCLCKNGNLYNVHPAQIAERWRLVMDLNNLRPRGQVHGAAWNFTSANP